jgi:large subunit ribosomal protein L29
MKVDELRSLAEDELDTRLRAARRELYELRFKHAVGQLENSSQISKVRHDMARILTVVNERALGISTLVVDELAPVARPSRAERAETPVDEGFEPEAENAEAPVAEPAKPKRGRKAKSEEGA